MLSVSYKLILKRGRFWKLIVLETNAKNLTLSI